MKLYAFEENWATDLSRALVPPDTFGGLAGRADVGAGFREHLDNSPWWSALVVRLAIWIAFLSPLFVVGKLALFDGLDRDTKERHLEKLLYARMFELRQMMMLLKMTACLVIVGQPEVLRHIGAYDLGPQAIGSSRPAEPTHDVPATRLTERSAS